jgi:2-polyprenyl-3-methyl-5-hydroxy-6-metoxy-1,4-benzoquinol methylase
MSGYVPFNERRHRTHAKLVAAVGTGNRVLDVGCSSGYLSEPVAANGNTVVGIELDPEAARGAERFCERVLVGDVTTMELPFEPGSFDVVLLGDVIEHLREPVAALARLRPLLRPGGKLVLSTPNVANWAVRLSLLAGRWDYTDRGLLDRTHVHLFTRRSLVRAVEAAGYRVVDVDFTVPFPGDSDALDTGARAVGRLRPTLFAYQWVVTAVEAAAGGR